MVNRSSVKVFERKCASVNLSEYDPTITEDCYLHVTEFCNTESLTIEFSHKNTKYDFTLAEFEAIIDCINALSSDK